MLRLNDLRKIIKEYGLQVESTGKRWLATDTDMHNRLATDPHGRTQTFAVGRSGQGEKTCCQCLSVPAP